MNATNFLKGAGCSFFSTVRILAAMALLALATRAAETPLVPQGAVWRHLNNGTPPGEGWRMAAFSDENWPSGRAQLGYGDGDEATRTQGEEMSPRPITAYFRHRFDVADATAFSGLVLRLLRDDGAVVYLNGTQVARSNMPDGPVTPQTLAIAAVGGEDENRFYPFEVSTAVLRTGVNVLAVEVHQVNASSSDLSFDLALIGVTGQTPERPVVGVVATRVETAEPTPTTRVAPAVFTFSRTGDLTLPLSVAVRFDGSATPGTDYPSPPERISFEAGQQTQEYHIVANPDDAIEETERVILVLGAAPTGPDGAPIYAIHPERSRAEIAIHNSSPPPPPSGSIVGIVATRPTTSEATPNGAVSGLFTVRRVGGLEQPLRVLLRYTGSATPQADYSALPEAVEFAAGQSARPIEVRALADDAVEGPETVVAEIVLPPEAPGYQIAPDAARAVVTINDVNQPAQARIEINAPASGQAFEAGAAITVRARAVDPAGHFARLEFFAGDTRIGVSEIVFVQEPEPGTPITHEIVWQNAPAGEHTLTARGTSSSGAHAVSGGVRIVVRDHDGDAPVVSIRFVELPSGEPVPNADYSPGSLEVRRMGGTDQPLQVFYRLAEVGIPELPLATPGVDYERLPGSIVIPAGHSIAYIRVQAIDDTFAESREMVPVQLIPTPPNVDPVYPSNYRIDPEHAGAALFIIDNDGPVSAMVRIAHPQSGRVYTFGDAVEMRAEVANVQNFSRLEILADGQVLETFTALHAGYWFVWHGAAVGPHVLSAKLYANGGVIESEPVRILVRERAETAFVHRALPDGYQPGVAFRVELRAEPPDGARSYAVEDAPPTGWETSEISHDGVFDPLTRKVKFGPFLDGNDRVLTYMVRPPVDGPGFGEFDGTGSVDGHAYVIAGDNDIRMTPGAHPGDANSDFALNISETTAYAAAWRSGESWPAGPSPIPLSFVTRAGFLWRNGENYVVRPNVGPPECWIPANIQPGGHDDGDMAAVRSGAERLEPGTPAAIQISVAPRPGTSAYGIEEGIPAGWTVSDISHEGTFDAARRVIRWGVFYNAEPRAFTYTITPPADVAAVGHFAGRFSMDGVVTWIGGRDHVVSFDEENRPRLGEFAANPDGTVHLRLTGPAGQVGVLQFSTDLVRWEDVTTLFMPDGQVEFTAERGGRPAGYYRVQVR